MLWHVVFQAVFIIIIINNNSNIIIVLLIIIFRLFFGAITTTTITITPTTACFGISSSIGWQPVVRLVKAQCFFKGIV